MVFLCDGYPFLRGLTRELASGRPGMMTLTALAITTAYLYSAAVSFGLPGMVFYWELATLLVVAVSTALSARRGLLVRNRTAFENARNIGAVIFDKTGTLTEGRFAVRDTVSLEAAMDERQLLRYAASVEAHSKHPIARGIAGSADRAFPVEGFRTNPGKGAEGRVNGRGVRVVSPGYLRERGLEANDECIGRLLGQGKTVVFVLLDGRPAGVVALADVAIPLAAGALYGLGILLSPALGAVFMSLSTVIVAINARFLKV
jgi:P-type E1-E2 ATPase